MDSELSSVEEFEDSVLVESSDSGQVDASAEAEHEAYDEFEDEYDQDLDAFPEEPEDDYYDEEEDEYTPENKKPVAKATKSKKQRKQTTQKEKDSKITTGSRQSSRVRKHVDYDQTIDDEEFFFEEEERPEPPKKKKSKIELVEMENTDSEDELAVQNDREAEDGNSSDMRSNVDSVTGDQQTEENQQRRSKMLENLIGLQAKKHGNRKEFTDEEVQLRKAETARKRKNFIEKRLEEEKQDVLNKLLKRRAVKTKSSNKPAATGSDKNASAQYEQELDTETGFVKQRRPYIATGMTRTIINKSKVSYSLP